MKKIASLLAFINIVLWSLKFSVLSRQSWNVLPWWYHLSAATLHLFLERTFQSPKSFPSCEVVTVRMDLATDRFVSVSLANEKFHPGERSSIFVLARPPNRNCCRPLWYAEFPNHQLCSRSWVVLI